jgi:ABC-type transport system involved in multi-copper enzyme maturation permease subunit
VAATAAVAFSENDPASSTATSRKKARAKRVWDNPVLWREVGRPLFAARWQSIGAAVILVGVLIATYAIAGANRALGDRDAQIGYAVIFNGLFWLAVAVLAGTAIAQEHESDTWTLLLATPLAPAQIVLGKVIGLYRRMLWPTVLILLHFTAFAIAGIIGWITWFWVLWIIVTFNSVWVATGVYLSLRLARVTFAVILNLILAIVTYAAVPLLLLVLGQTLAHTTKWIEASGVWIPYVYLGMGVQAFSRGFVSSQPAELPTGGWGTSGGLLSMGIVAGVTHLGVACGIVALTIARFNAIVGRAPQLLPISRSVPAISSVDR